MPKPLSLRAPALIAFCALATQSYAQTPLSGPLSDSTTGPLLSGVVYHTTSNISVVSSATLTIQSGAIIKFGFDHRFDVNGTLLCNGVLADSVIFTDLRDDTAGGDTNGDGNATFPNASWWRGVQFTSGSSASQVTGLTVRYGGRFIPNFNLSDCSAVFTNCRSEESAIHAWNLNTSSFPTLTNCAAVNCLGEAFFQAPLAALPLFSGLSAVGNSRDRLMVSSGSVIGGAAITITPQNLLSGSFTTSDNINISSGSSLTLEAGIGVKLSFDRSVIVQGTLTCNGTSGNPVVFTDERDDTVGGDSNGNGSASVPAAGFWRGIDLRSTSDASSLENVDVRYAGRFISGLELSSSDALLRSCRVLSSSGGGIDLNGSSFPTIDGLRVEDCAGEALNRVDIHALAGIGGLDFVGNTFDRVHVTAALVMSGESITLHPSHSFLNTLYMDTNISVESGATLNIAPGMILKMSFDRRISVSGNLQVNGTPGQRVRFTEERDDSVGGDTNGNGNASSPGAGWWRGIDLQNNADGSSIQFADVSYGGRFISAFEITNAAVTINRCRIQDCTSSGIDFNNSSEVCVIDRVVINRCTSAAIEKVRFERLQDIEFASGADNSQNTILVTNGTLTSNATIERNNQFNGSILCASNIIIPSGVELNLESGVVIKMSFDRRITVNGSLTIRASLEDPVILTEERDDTVGGDTNGNGSASTPTAGYWRGVHFTASSGASIALGLEVRYGGRFQPNIICDGPSTVMRDVRVSGSSSAGLRVSAHAIDLEGIVAYGNADDGIQLVGGGFDLRRVTSVNNGGLGVEATAAFTGDLKDSIFWANTQGALAGLGTGRVRFSNGDASLAGSDGNIDTDPLFADLGQGDLQLTLGSPCINTGDPASPLDPDSTRADMGAYFFNICAPSVICTQPASFAPCSPTISFDGFASVTSPAPFRIRLSAAPTQSFALFFFGIGSPTTLTAPFGDICVAAPHTRSGAFPSGGIFADGNCAGQFSFDFNDFLQNGAASGVAVGSNVIGHFWYRYPTSPLGAVFSDGVQLPVCP